MLVLEADVAAQSQRFSEVAENSSVHHLGVFQRAYPPAFFFRVSESLAANADIAYDQWDQTLSVLMGIEGKVLDEEVPGRSRRNVAFFKRFKQRHPDQIVLLHFNGNARDPRFESEEYSACHWLYYNGAGIMSDVKAETGETDIQVSDAQLFHVGTGRYQDKNEDIGLCMLDDRGRPDWSRSEQAQLVSVDQKRGTIRVRRGCFGTKPQAFPAGKAYAAAHVWCGPWGRHSNLLWRYNYSTCCPRNVHGRACADVLAAELARAFAAGGRLATFDGVEFDVLQYDCAPSQSARARRGVDCNADGRIDNGIVDGVNAYGIGTLEFCRQLQTRLGGQKLVLADGMSLHNQRAFGVVNGIESEGWPTLSDWEIRDWSGGLNRHWFWQKNARAPVFNYINHKYTTAGEEPGQRRRPAVPFSTHRLVLAAAQFIDAAVCYTWMPRADAGEAVGVWDELWMGSARKPGWLGKPLTPAVRLAREAPDLLHGQGRVMPDSFVSRWRGEDVVFGLDGNDLCVKSTDSRAKQLRFRLKDVPCSGPDLFISVTMRADSMVRYPPEIARLTWVGIPKPQTDLVREDMPATGMCVRGQKEIPLQAVSGAAVRWVPAATLEGESRDAYWVHPPYRGGTGYTFWQRAVEVPQDSYLEFMTGMGERAPGRSDGVVFRVLVAELDADAEPGFRLAFEHTQIRPNWERHSLSLAAWAGKRVFLRFLSDCGPADNATTDHSLWGDVRIVEPGSSTCEVEPVRFMTWTNSRRFTSGFYFSSMKSNSVDVEFQIEGREPVWISDMTAHASADMMYREFENGVVFANPAPHPVTFDLDKLLPAATFRRIQGSSTQDPETNNGSIVYGTLSLQRRDGLFLVTEKK